jgi:hypothetical protein
MEFTHVFNELLRALACVFAADVDDRSLVYTFMPAVLRRANDVCGMKALVITDEVMIEPTGPRMALTATAFNVVAGKWTREAQEPAPPYVTNISVARLFDGSLLASTSFETNSLFRYDPAAPSFRHLLTDDYPEYTRALVTAADGRVVVFGNVHTLAEHNDSPRIYTPATGQLTVSHADINNNALDRFIDTAVLLADGRILVMSSDSSDVRYYISGCRLYAPVSDTIIDTVSMQMARVGAAAVRLPNGNVLVTGGRTKNKWTSNECEEYIPQNQLMRARWIRGPPLPTGRANHSMCLLSSINKVLLVGGIDESLRGFSETCFLYDIAARRWEVIPAPSLGGVGPVAVQMINSHAAPV